MRREEWKAVFLKHNVSFRLGYISIMSMHLILLILRDNNIYHPIEDWFHTSDWAPKTVRKGDLVVVTRDPNVVIHMIAESMRSYAEP